MVMQLMNGWAINYTFHAHIIYMYNILCESVYFWLYVSVLKVYNVRCIDAARERVQI